MPENNKNLHSLLRELKEPIIIGISGDSGSGKTTYGNGIRRLFGTDLVQTIDMDGYHKENREQRKITGHLPLDPAINNLSLLKTHLEKLKKGESVEIPIYNHSTGDFDPPKNFIPSPIIVVEGLHALYPEFTELLDFGIYVDPTRDVKWEWKYIRDVEVRHHEVEPLLEEMLKREAAYKRWIDFQKTNANVVIKIKPSRLKDLARYEFACSMPKGCYRVELIIQPAQVPLPNVPLPFNLASFLDPNYETPFMLAAVPSTYWGKSAMVVHIDGVLSDETIKALEDHICNFTGIPLSEVLEKGKAPSLGIHEKVTATQFAQLLIAWRFLELINYQLPE